MKWFCGGPKAVRLGIVSLATVASLVSGCGKEEKAVPAAKAEVKGEPIRGEPIAQAPTPAPTPVKAAVPDPAPATEVAVVSTPKAPEPVTSPTPSATPAATVVATPAASLNQAPQVAAAGAGTSQSPLVVGFDKLASFKYDLPDGQVDTNTVAQTGAANQIPAPIKALNNQFISLKGFMLPLKVEKGLVTEMLMMRDQSMCCYGAVPRINEWVSVKMVGTGVKPIMDQAVTLFGKLKVGEMYENGYLVGIYSLDGERMAGPLDM